MNEFGKKFGDILKMNPIIKNNVISQSVLKVFKRLNDLKVPLTKEELEALAASPSHG